MPQQPCAHCGRTGLMLGSYMFTLSPAETPPGAEYARRQVKLCHANRDGTKADIDCYHLVTVCGEPLGSRLGVGDPTG